jgi:hypothetical protein
MTMTVESMITRVKPWIERIEPCARRVYEIIVSVVTFCWGSALTLASGGFLILAGYGMSLPDATMMMQNGGQPASDTRIGLLILSAIALAGLIWGLRVLYDWFRPRENHQRVADLETRLITAEQFAAEAQERADYASEYAEEKEWATHALAAVAEVFRIEGVLDAARKAARKALHPDAHPGVSEQDIRDLTERFQMAEAVFARFSN